MKQFVEKRKIKAVKSLSLLDAPAHKHMDRDADSNAARKARLSDS